MKDFRELAVWEKAHRLTLEAYQTTSHFPKEEMYGLTSQLRRASASIPTNIAEGCGRGSDADFARFVQNAMGSASEVEYLLVLAHDLRYIPTLQSEALSSQVTEIKRMLTGLLRKLRADR